MFTGIMSLTFQIEKPLKIACHFKKAIHPSSKNQTKYFTFPRSPFIISNIEWKLKNTILNIESLGKIFFFEFLNSGKIKIEIVSVN